MEELHIEIDRIAHENKNRAEYSMRRAGEACDKYLDELGINNNSAGGGNGSEPSILAVGAKTNLTGLHFDLAIYDDLMAEENAKNEDTINEIIRKFENDHSDSPCTTDSD